MLLTEKARHPLLFLLTNIIFLALAVTISWWLSGFDNRLTGENEIRDRARRYIRCGFTLLIVEVSFWSLWCYWRYKDSASGALYLLTLVPLLAIWAGCISEMVAQGFTWLIDPHSDEEFDSKKDLRVLDAVASLVKSGRKEEAIQVCQMLKESGDASVTAMETMLEHLGVQREASKPKPLTEAYRLRAEGKFEEAEKILNSLLAENPSNVDAAMMLMRMYVQDMRHSDRAAEVLRELQKQPYIPAGHLEYARRSIHDWGRKKIEPKAVILPEPVDELLACGYFGTAIEILEQKIKEQPDDFELRLKLAEIHGLHCRNIHRVEKMIEKMEFNFTFKSEQIQLAKTKLREWRETKSNTM